MEGKPAGRVTYRYVGASGLKVSSVCLGTMTFGEKPEGPSHTQTKGGPGQCTEEESHRIMDRFAEWGGNFIDTANIYSNGSSEKVVGTWLKKQNRDNFVVATKIRFGPDAENPNGTGLSRTRILTGAEESLRRLQTDYIDLYQIHMWDDAVPIEETLCALNDLVRLGKVRYLGASNMTGWQMQKIVDISKMRGWVPWISCQQQYSLLCRQCEFELMDVCRNEGIGILPWSPLKGGWLSGKVSRDVSTLPDGSRLAWASADKSRPNQSHPSYQQFAGDEKVWKLLDTMKDIGSQQGGRTMAQIALRWLLQQDTVSSTVIGVKNLSQLDDNIKAGLDWELTLKQMNQLDEASALELPYPYEMIQRLSKGRRRDK